MNNKKNFRFLSPLLAGALSLSAMILPAAANEIGDRLLIINTNDVHCSVDKNMGYAGLAAYRDDMIKEYGEDYVILVDSGDAIQGGPLGTLTEGQAIIDLMNAVEYDYFAPGNHEYDYGMERGLDLMGQLSAHVISANFMDLTTGLPVYDGYDVVDFGEVQVGFVGMTTPESFTKSTPFYFQNDAGEYIYGFGEAGNDLYDYVQVAIDGAIEEGADFIVAIGHMGNEDGTAPWRSTDVISNTTGINVFVDGHSHETMESETYMDANGDPVVLTQTGSHFDNVGEIVLDLKTLDFTVSFVPEGYEEKSSAVTAVLSEINQEFDALLDEVVASSQVDLITNHPETDEHLIRAQETNLGNLVADAYRVELDAEVGLANGGGIRAGLPAGDITYGDIIEVHPFGNEMSVLSVSGQTLLDALEMGARNTPTGSGGFLHVSGMTYQINTAVETSVVLDEKGNFISVEGDYRVTNVEIDGTPLNLDQMYTVASHDYMLMSAGDGMTMFLEQEVLKDRIMVDNELLIRYIKDELGGVIGSEYGDAFGAGRIQIIDEIITPEEVEPEVTQPEEAEPEVTQPEEVEPEVTQPEEVEPEVTQPEEVEPEVTQPEVVEPEVTQPEVVEPEVTQPEVVVPVGSYVVVNGDNLSHIARDILGNANRWNEIYQLNKDIIRNPDLISIGQVLKMPAA